jgi:hypothetical protein
MSRTMLNVHSCLAVSALPIPTKRDLVAFGRGLFFAACLALLERCQSMSNTQTRLGAVKQTGSATARQAQRRPEALRESTVKYRSPRVRRCCQGGVRGGGWLSCRAADARGHAKTACAHGIAKRKSMVLTVVVGGLAHYWVFFRPSSRSGMRSLRG